MMGRESQPALRMRLSRRAMLRNALLAGVSVAGVLRAGGRLAAQPLDAQASDVALKTLIARMTPEEKAGQLSMFRSPKTTAIVNPEGFRQPSRVEAIEDARQGRACGYFNGFDPAFHRALQRAAVEESRLKIPLIFAADIVHGLATVFPIPLGEAASFDPELCRRTARIAAREGSAFGVHWTFAPAVDIARDERWGRVLEGAGEDVWLGAKIAAARVRGFQGEDLRAQDSLLACPKHFAGYGGVEGGMEYNTVELSEAALRQTHLPPFQAAFSAGALATMAAFNDIGGVPCTADAALLTGLLRDDWGFPGLVISDYGGVPELIAHGYAEDEADAVIKALTAGCDLSLGDDLFERHIPRLLRDGRLPEAIVDRAVLRVLRVKQALGLFDDPYRGLDRDDPTPALRQPDALALAREAARKSMVLLKNDGELLPLPKSGRKIAFIGPFVSDRHNVLGAWTLMDDPDHAATLEQGVRAALPPDAEISFTPACAPEREIDGGFDAALAAARAADIVVLHLGEPAGHTGEASSTTGILLPAVQQRLADAIFTLGKPTVAILKHGRALALAGGVRDAQAILCAWFLGSQSGFALADVLFGDVSPQGRLPVSFPQSSGQEPFFYNHRPTGRPQTGPDPAFKARYREVADEALYPFGHGLTYSRVAYGPTELSSPALAGDGAATVSALLKNTGRRAVVEVAQLYIHRRAATITQPVRQLRGVDHVALAPGEEKRVVFTLRREDLAYVQPDLSLKAPDGAIEVWIAPSAAAGTPATLRLS